MQRTVGGGCFGLERIDAINDDEDDMRWRSLFRGSFQVAHQAPPQAVLRLWHFNISQMKMFLQSSCQAEEQIGQTIATERGPNEMLEKKFVAMHVASSILHPIGQQRTFTDA
jgi:hypothetical protein